MKKERTTSSRHYRYGVLACFSVVILGALARFYKIMFHYATNGVDEGIQLMASKLMHDGYTLYEDFNTLQAPLGQWILSTLEGDIFLSRILIAIFSIIGLIGVMLLIKREAGIYPAAIAGLMMAFSTLYLKESRIASLDMMVTTLLILSFVFLTFAYYKKGKQGFIALAAAGLLFGCGIMVKLFAVVPFMMILGLWGMKTLKETLEKRAVPWGDITRVALISLSSLLVILTVLLIFNPSLVMDGMFFANLEVRDYQSLTVKLGIIGYFFLLNSPILIFSALGMKDLIKRKQWFIPTWFFSLLAWFLLQPLTYDHHLLLLIPPLYIAGGVGIKITLDYIQGNLAQRKKWMTQKKTSFTIAGLVCILLLPLLGGAGWEVSTVEEPIEYQVADTVANLTQEHDFILSGDPAVGLMADRNQVPELVNVARTAYPELNASSIIEYCERYQVNLIVVTYYLAEIEGMESYVQGNYSYICGYTQEGIAITTPEGNWTQENYLVYLKYPPGNSTG